MPTTNTAFSVTDINGEEFDLISNFIVLVKENPSNSSYADVTYVVDKYSRIKKTITSLTASQVSDEAGNLFECTIDGTTAFLNADLVIDIQDNGDGCDIVYSNYDDVSTTYTLEESRNDIETAINDLLPSGGGITNSAGNKYIPKSDGTNLIQSVIYEDTFVAINDTTQTAASEKLLVKVSSDNYGVVHSDGTRIGGTYSDAVGFWFGSYSNHDVIFFTNNTETPLKLIASTGNVDIERNLIMSNGNGTSGTIIFEGATADTYETTLTVADPTADRTITLPNATGTVALTDSITANYVIKSDGTKSVQSQIFDNGTFVGVNASTITSAAERFQIKTSVDKYGWIHTDGNVRGGSYISLAGIWLGTQSNHSLSIFTNDGAAQAVFNTDGSFAVAGVVKADSHNTRDLGTSTRAWKDLYLSGTITFEGSTDDSFETTLTVADPTADRTITLPNASGTVSLQTGQTYTPSNVTTSRTFDADTVTLAELADIVGTLLTDLSGKVNN